MPAEKEEGGDLVSCRPHENKIKIGRTLEEEAEVLECLISDPHRTEASPARRCRAWRDGTHAATHAASQGVGRTRIDRRGGDAVGPGPLEPAARGGAESSFFFFFFFWLERLGGASSTVIKKRHRVAFFFSPRDGN